MDENLINLKKILKSSKSRCSDKDEELIMRKVWISRDQLIPKPFYKRKLFFFFIIVLIFAIIFIIYQFIFINQLATNNRIELLEVSKHVYKSHKLVDVKPLQPALDHKKLPYLGIRIRDLEHYQPRYTNQLFKCLNSPDEEISFNKVNDDFCDCSDGTDETSTNACNNGKFYCTKQMRHTTGRGQDVYVPTSRINDKICDCTDCSDEFT